MSPSSCSLLGKGGEGADVAQPLPPLGGERKSWPWWGQQVPDCHKALCHPKESVSRDHTQSRVLLEEAHPGREQVTVRRRLAGCRWPAGLEEGQVQAVPRGEGHRLSRVDAGVVKPCSAVICEFWRRGLEGPRSALRARVACSRVVLGAAVCPSAVQSLPEGCVWRALVPLPWSPRHLWPSLVCPGRRHRRASPRQLGVAGLGPCQRSRPPGGGQCVL